MTPKSRNLTVMFKYYVLNSLKAHTKLTSTDIREHGPTVVLPHVGHVEPLSPRTHGGNDKGQLQTGTPLRELITLYTSRRQ